MSQHWESSGRPLFVKTIYVNGNRHAILSEQDPFSQSGRSFVRKQIRSHSSMSFSSVYTSFNTQGSESSDSEVSFQILKGQPSGSKDISSDLQRCLVKWRLSSAVQDSKDQLGSTQQIASKSLPRRRRKKSNNCKANKTKRGTTPEVLSELNDYGKEVHREYCRREKDFFPPADIGICDFDKNNVENESNGNEAVHCEKRDSELGETLHSLIMRNRDKGKIASDKSHECLYTISNSNTCEMYWNNYLATSFKVSLVERVVQWMDLVKRQRKDEKITYSISNVSGRNESREETSTRNNNYVHKITGKSEGNDIRKSHSGMPFSKEIDHSHKDFSNDYAEAIDGEATPFASTIQVESISCKGESKINTQISHVGDEEKKQGMENDLVARSIAVKNKSKTLQLVSLQNSIAHQLQATVLHRPKQAIFKAENKTPNPRYFKKYKNLWCQDYIIDTFKNNEEGSRMEKISGILEKRIISARNSRNDSMDRSGIYRENLKSRRQKGTMETIKLNNGRTWMSTVLDDSYTSINHTSLTQHLVNHNLLLEEEQNDRLGPRESKVAWDTEKGLEKPQLHIFIPSICQREVNEFENPSECESF